jgi:ankyrin repeat protein
MSESGDNRRQATTLLSNELFAHCESDSLSVDGLREIIIERHECASPNRNPNIDYKFFLAACRNEKVTEGIIQCLLEYFPEAASATNNNGCSINDNDIDGWTPLHYACWNKNITLNIIQLLIDAAPTTVRAVDDKGNVPLHILCANKSVDEIIAREILNLLIEKHPEAVRHATNNGTLPIYFACASRPHEFCRVLIEAYPGSERITGVIGLLPLHYACMYNTVAVVEYLYHLYPDAINHATTNGKYPIHLVIGGLRSRDNPAAAVDVVKFLLDCDPNVLQKHQRRLSLVACLEDNNDSNIEARIQFIKVIYDAHPEAIKHKKITSNIHRYHQRVQTFINSQLVYSHQARNHRLMTTPNEQGQLPLHIALQNNVRLGSIKLLVKGNPSAIRSFNRSGVIPLHLACQHHDSASVVQYLLSLSEITLDTVDREGNTALHHACLGAKHDTIALLLEKYDAVSVSKRNAHKKLPIDLLFETNEVLDRESVQYTESIFRLLRAYPETVMNIRTSAEKQSTSAACTSSIEKKREFAYELFEIAKAIICPKIFRAKQKTA